VNLDWQVLDRKLWAIMALVAIGLIRCELTKSVHAHLVLVDEECRCFSLFCEGTRSTSAFTPQKWNLRPMPGRPKLCPANNARRPTRAPKRLGARGDASSA